MSSMELVAEKREQFGKATRSLRRRGIIPAELYGHGVPNQHLAVSARDFRKIFAAAGENTLVTLTVGPEEHSVMIHDVEKDFLSGEVSHVDFYQVKLDEKIKAKVPFEFTGDAPAVKTLGGIVNKAMIEIEVEALPKDMPHRIILPLDSLDELGKSLRVKDVVVPKGARVLVGPETVVVTITEPRKEEEKPPEVADVNAVKVEAEEKKAERDLKKAKEVPPEAGAEKAAR